MKLTHGIFITGTDTDVGKTAVTAALLMLLRQRGVDAVPMKPIQTGCLKHGDDLVAPDLDQCLRAIHLTPTVEEAEWMCPYRYIPACSPHLAARIARRPIQMRRMVSAFRQLAARHDFVIAEGAGGVLVPLDERRTMLDLMRALGLPVLVVARPNLGTLNHTLLTLAALRAAGLKIVGVVVVSTKRGRRGRIERDNLASIARLGRVKVLGRLPFIASKRDFRATALRFSKDWKMPPTVFPRLGKNRVTLSQALENARA
jgi:dethiobiotin synthetase